MGPFIAGAVHCCPSTPAASNLIVVDGVHIGTWQLSGPAVPAKLAEHAAWTQNGRQVVEQTCIMLPQRRHRHAAVRGRCCRSTEEELVRSTKSVHPCSLRSFCGPSALVQTCFRAGWAATNTTSSSPFVDNNDNLTSDIHQQQRCRSCCRRPQSCVVLPGTHQEYSGRNRWKSRIRHAVPPEVGSSLSTCR